MIDSTVEMTATYAVVDGSDTNLLYEVLRSQRQDAEVTGNFEAYVIAEEKLQQLEEFEVQRLERQARLLDAHVRIKTAQRQLNQADAAMSTHPVD